MPMGRGCNLPIHPNVMRELESVFGQGNTLVAVDQKIVDLCNSGRGEEGRSRKETTREKRSMLSTMLVASLWLTTSTKVQPSTYTVSQVPNDQSILITYQHVTATAVESRIVGWNAMYVAGLTSEA